MTAKPSTSESNARLGSKTNVVNLCPREYGELANAHTSINPCLLLSYPTHSGHNEIAKLVEALLLYSIVIEVQTLALVPTIFVDCLFGRSPYEQSAAHVGQHGQACTCWPRCSEGMLRGQNPSSSTSSNGSQVKSRCVNLVLVQKTRDRRSMMPRWAQRPRSDNKVVPMYISAGLSLTARSYTTRNNC